MRKGSVVSSQHPRTASGLYWGYSVRLASCLSECPRPALLLLGLHTPPRNGPWKPLSSQKQLTGAVSSPVAGKAKG